MLFYPATHHCFSAAHSANEKIAEEDEENNNYSFGNEAEHGGRKD